MKIKNRDLFDIISFLSWYRDRLKIFGESFIDSRLIDSIHILCNIVAKRITKTNLTLIQNIIKSVI